MQAHSVIRQRSLLVVVAGFVLPLLLGCWFLLAVALRVPGFDSVVSVALGALLVLVSLALIVGSMLSLSIAARADATGLTSEEVGARWSYGWAAVDRVWIVYWRGQQYLAVLPAPATAPAWSRTSWRSRRMQLPDAVRTVRIAPESVPALAATVQAYRGWPPEPHSA